MIGKYIVDFDCSSAKIALELDGGQHFEDHALTYDDERTQWLNENGIKVLRFLNPDVSKNLSDVCTTIEYIVKDRLDELVK